VRVSRSADARRAVVSEPAPEKQRRWIAIRRDEPLGQRAHGRLVGQAALLERGDDLAKPGRGDAQQHVVGAAQTRFHAFDPQLPR